MAARPGFILAIRLIMALLLPSRVGEAPVGGSSTRSVPVSEHGDRACHSGCICVQHAYHRPGICQFSAELAGDSEDGVSGVRFALFGTLTIAIGDSEPCSPACCSHPMCLCPVTLWPRPCGTGCRRQGQRRRCAATSNGCAPP